MVLAIAVAIGDPVEVLAPTSRPCYGCRSCEITVIQAQAPARIIEGGIPTEALIAQVLVAKHANHLPMYPQAQIYARQGYQARPLHSP